METIKPKNFARVRDVPSIVRPKGCMAYVRNLTTYTSPVAFDPERAMGTLACDRASCPIEGSVFDKTIKTTVSGGGKTPQEAIGAALASAEAIVRDHC